MPPSNPTFHAEVSDMRIQSILQRKGSDVVTVAPEATMHDAAATLARHGLGALVVSRDGRSIEGILSERDLARALASEGAAALDRPVAQLMTRKVTTCSTDETVDELAAVMTEQRVRHVPVVEDGMMIGIVSIGDVVKHRLDELEAEARTLHEYIELGR